MILRTFFYFKINIKIGQDKNFAQV